MALIQKGGSSLRRQESGFWKKGDMEFRNNTASLVFSKWATDFVCEQEEAFFFHLKGCLSR